MSEFCVFFHDQKYHTYCVYYHHLNKYEETDYIPDTIDKFEYSKLTKKGLAEKNKEGIEMKDILKKYSQDIQFWRDELLGSKKLILPYDHFAKFKKNDGTTFINTNESNILRFFNKYSSKIYTNDKFDKIVWKEYLWFEKENLASLQRCCVSGEYKTLGFDFKMAYPHILSSRLEINGELRPFYFPIKEGIRFKLKSLFKYKKCYNNDDELAFGMYRIKISSTDERFNYIFNFSHYNVYTHTDIEFCKFCIEKYKMDITFDLIVDEEYNALLYKRNDIIDGSKVFASWLDRILELREEFPKNGLIKQLSSSIWGFLSKTNKRYYNDEELYLKPEIKTDLYDSDNINYLCLHEKDNKNGTTDYLLINKEQPYTKNYRLKPFLKSFERVIMAEICLEIGLEKILRINTDNITLNRELLTESDIKNIRKISPTFIEEDKTTTYGNEIMYIKNVNDMVKKN